MGIPVNRARISALSKENQKIVETLYEKAEKSELTGWYADIPNECYHLGPGISNSGITLFEQSPKKYFDNYFLSDELEKSTPAKAFGQYLHTAVFEQETFHANFKRLRDIDKDLPNMHPNTKAYKAILSDFKDENPDAIVIKNEKEYDTILYMADQVLSHPTAGHLIKSAGVSEVSFFLQDPFGDGQKELILKSRPDRWLTGSRSIIDYKTTEDARTDVFEKSIHKYRYHVQGAIGSDVVSLVHGEPVEHVILIAQEKTRPYDLICHSLDVAAIEKGRELYKQSLTNLSECLAKNEWPGYESGLHMASLSYYAF